MNIWSGNWISRPTRRKAALGVWGFAALRKFMEVTARKDTFEPGAWDRYVGSWSHPGSLTAMLNLRERKSGKEPARLASPVLILCVEKDSFLERHVAEAGVAPYDQGRLEVVAGTTHWLHF